MKPQVALSHNSGENIFTSFILKSLALYLEHNNISSLVKALLREGEIEFFLKKADINKKEIAFIDISKEELYKKAFDNAKETGAMYAGTIALFSSYLLLTEQKTKLLFNKELKPEDILSIANWGRMYVREMPKEPEVVFWGHGIADDWVSGWTLETQKYTRDFSQKAVKDSFPVVEREKEIKLTLEALLKENNQNVILVGPPGVGKTTIVSTLAIRMFLGQVPRSISGKRILELSVGALLAGAETQGELEERVKNIVAELEHAQDVILYIPEIQNVLGSGGLKLDMSGALLPELSGGKLQIIGTCTPENYKSYVEKNAPFQKLFETIIVKEPTKEEALIMLEHASLRLEKKHSVTILYKAILSSLDLSKRYIPYKFLPGKAIDLLDQAAARSVLRKDIKVTSSDIEKLIEEKTQIVVSKPQSREKEILLHLEEILHERVVDQDEGVKTVAKALQRLRAGLAFENRPVGVFLFLGPTGVGKTEVARTLAATYFGSEDAMIRLEMGSYKEASSLNRLIGAPPGMGEEKGELTEKVRESPFSLILLDEFEKADRNILDVFLSIFEDGVISDAKGRSISFINTIIIATSNAGSEFIREKVQEGEELQKLKEELLNDLQKQGVFKPELLNRFDSVVLFEPLGEREFKEVTKLLLAKVSKKLLEQDITVEFDEKAITLIAKDGFDPEFGARPLRRYIQDHIENLLAEKKLKEEIKRGDTIIITVNNQNEIQISHSM